MESNQFKFRGLDANGVMRYGRLSQDEEGSTSYYDEYSQRICWGDSNIPVSNKSLGMSTGYKDINDKEIYSGDIIDPGGFTVGKRYIVRFGNFSYEGGYEGVGFYCEDDGRQLEEYGFKFDECQIIGNIHENIKLLESKDGK